MISGRRYLPLQVGSGYGISHKLGAFSHYEPGCSQALQWSNGTPAGKSERRNKRRDAKHDISLILEAATTVAG